MGVRLSTIRNILILLCLIAIVCVVILWGLIWRAGHHESAAIIPDYGAVPGFSLVERNGKTVTLADLKGHILIVDFIFTTCPGPCPVMTGRMKNLQDELKEKPDVRLVSVTVDPETDTPAVLSKYADSFGADPSRWYFLTGPRSAIKSLATDGLHLTLEVNTGASAVPGQGPIVHSTRFVLVDGRGHLRGYYDSTDNRSLQQLLRDIDQLQAEEQR